LCGHGCLGVVEKIMKYQVQFGSDTCPWRSSASNPPKAEGWDSRGDAAIQIAIRLSDPLCKYAFRIVEIPEQEHAELLVEMERGHQNA
jgi:hypothetical protein